MIQCLASISRLYSLLERKEMNFSLDFLVPFLSRKKNKEKVGKWTKLWDGAK